MCLATASFHWASCGSSLQPYATLSFYHSLPCLCCFSLAITTLFSPDTELLALLAVGFSLSASAALVLGFLDGVMVWTCCPSISKLQLGFFFHSLVQ